MVFRSKTPNFYVKPVLALIAAALVLLQTIPLFFGQQAWASSDSDETEKKLACKAVWEFDEKQGPFPGACEEVKACTPGCYVGTKGEGGSGPCEDEEGNAHGQTLYSQCRVQPFDWYYNEAKKDQLDGKGENYFSYIVKRVFHRAYLNDTELGVGVDGRNRAKNCDLSQSNNGLGYHNCDVPNLATEFLQDFVAYMVPQGMVGAEALPAQTSFGIGVPSGIPTGQVPLNDANRVHKYTGLELVGYNLQFHNYVGEWDHVKVASKARMLANFGMMDNLRLAGTIIWQSITGAVAGAGDAIASSYSSGSWFWATLNLPWTIVQGTVNGSEVNFIKVVMDTSDLNVFNTFSWYRPQFGKTIYGARELSATELAKKQELAVMNLLGKINSSDSYKPTDFLDAKNPPKNEDPNQLINDEHPDWGTKITRKSFTLPEAKEKMDAARKYDLLKDCEGDCKIWYNLWAAKWSENWLKKYATDESWGVVSWLLDGQKKSLITKMITSIEIPAQKYVCQDFDETTIIQNKNDRQEPVPAFIRSGEEFKPNPVCPNVRLPIQDGIFGNGYPDGNSAPVDGRREVFRTPTILDFSPWASPRSPSGLANWFMYVAGGFTQLTNFAIDLSFSPILEKIGVKKVIVSLIGSLRDGVFAPLAAILVALGALYVLGKLLRNFSLKEQLINIALTITVFIAGSAVLINPNILFKIVDDGPAMVERAILSVFLESDTAEDGELCQIGSAPSTRKNIQNTDLDGKTTSFDTEKVTRILECKIWRVFMFDPWVFGQWGASYKDLYANGTTTPVDGNTLKNSNRALVGDASVKMGGGVTENNWALYNATKIVSGTLTTPSVENPAGTTSRSLYRIVDAQVGPNNNEGTDGRYFQTWSGETAENRVPFSFVALFASIVALGAFGYFAVIKIEISIILGLMLLILPVMLLQGLYPAKRAKLVEYLFGILGLMLRRIFIVLIFCLMIMFVSKISINATPQSYILTMFTICVLLAAFIIERKTIFSIMDTFVDASRAGVFAGATNTLGNFRGTIENAMPLSVKNRVAIKKATLGAGIAGGAAALFTGRGIRESANIAGSLSQNLEYRRSRRAGFGILDKAINAGEAGENYATKNFESGRFDDDVRQAIKGDENLVGGEATATATSDYSRQKTQARDLLGAKKPKIQREVRRQHDTAEKNYNKASRNLADLRSFAGTQQANREGVDAFDQSQRIFADSMASTREQEESTRQVASTSGVWTDKQLELLDKSDPSLLNMSVNSLEAAELFRLRAERAKRSEQRARDKASRQERKVEVEALREENENWD